MSDAFKCDGCEDYTDGKPAAVLTDYDRPVSQTSDGAGEAPREYDLCEGCLGKIRRTILSSETS
jgi:hypothetical protein